MIPILSNLDPSLAPAGKQLIAMGGALHGRPGDYTDEDWRRWEEAYLRALEIVFPGIRQHILWTVATTPVEIERRFGASLGRIRVLGGRWRWPGNLRQLEAVVQRARLRALVEDPDGTELDERHLDPSELGDAPVAAPAPAASPVDVGDGYRALVAVRATLDERERGLIEAALVAHGRVVTRAAQALGVGRTSLMSRMQTLRIKP